MLGSWLEEFDELVRDVQESNYSTFPLNLQRLFNFIDDHPLIGPRLAAWEAEAGFQEWYKAIPIEGGAVGGNRLPWPANTRLRLALHLGLFRAMSTGEIDVAPFALHFFYTQGNFDVQVANIGRRIFAPFVREIRREIQKFPLEEEGASIPASDRTVALDHNSAGYKELVEALDRLSQTIGQLNDYPDLELKERHIAEIAAGRELLKPRWARVEALWSVLRAPLRWFLVQFSKTEIGHIADLVWKLLLKLIS